MISRCISYGGDYIFIENKEIYIVLDYKLPSFQSNFSSQFNLSYHSKLASKDRINIIYIRKSMIPEELDNKHLQQEIPMERSIILQAQTSEVQPPL